MEFLVKYPEIVYGLSVCTLTFIILKYLITQPTSKQKFIVLLSSGVGLGVIFWLITDFNLPLMILSFLASIGFYEIVIKKIMKKLNTTYNDKDID